MGIKLIFRHLLSMLLKVLVVVGKRSGGWVRPTFAALALLCMWFSCYGQSPKCGETTGFVLNPDKPSVYLEFEQFGRADDWGSYRLGEPMKKPDIKKGDDVWLRLFNNSC